MAAVGVLAIPAGIAIWEIVALGGALAYAAQALLREPHRHAEIQSALLAQASSILRNAPGQAAALLSQIGGAFGQGAAATADALMRLARPGATATRTTRSTSPTSRTGAGATVKGPAARPSARQARPARAAAGAAAAATAAAPVRAAPAPALSASERELALRSLSAMVPTAAVKRALGDLGVKVTRAAQPLDSLPELTAQFGRLHALRSELGPKAWTLLGGGRIAAELQAVQTQLTRLMRSSADQSRELMTEAAALRAGGGSGTQAQRQQRLDAIGQQLQTLQQRIERSYAPLHAAGLYPAARHSTAAQIDAFRAGPQAVPSAPAAAPPRRGGAVSQGAAAAPSGVAAASAGPALPSAPTSPPAATTQPATLPTAIAPASTMPASMPTAPAAAVPATAAGSEAKPAAVTAAQRTTPAGAAAAAGAPAALAVAPVLQAQAERAQAAMVRWAQAMQAVRALPQDAPQAAREAALTGLRSAAADLRARLAEPELRDLLLRGARMAAGGAAAVPPGGGGALAAAGGPALPLPDQELLEMLLNGFANALASSVGDVAEAALTGKLPDGDRTFKGALLGLLIGATVPGAGVNWLAGGVVDGLEAWARQLVGIDPHDPTAVMISTLTGGALGGLGDALFRALRRATLTPALPGRAGHLAPFWQGITPPTVPGLSMPLRPPRLPWLNLEPLQKNANQIGRRIEALADAARQGQPIDAATAKRLSLDASRHLSRLKLEVRSVELQQLAQTDRVERLLHELRRLERGGG